VIEHQLRPLFAFFEAATLATGVYASDREFADGRPSAAALVERLDRAVDGFAPFLARSPSPFGLHEAARPVLDSAEPH
jgi:FMN reductase